MWHYFDYMPKLIISLDSKGVVSLKFDNKLEKIYKLVLPTLWSYAEKRLSLNEVSYVTTAAIQIKNYLILRMTNSSKTSLLK